MPVWKQILASPIVKHILTLAFLLGLISIVVQQVDRRTSEPTKQRFEGVLKRFSSRLRFFSQQSFFRFGKSLSPLPLLCAWVALVVSVIYSDHRAKNFEHLGSELFALVVFFIYSIFLEIAYFDRPSFDLSVVPEMFKVWINLLFFSLCGALLTGIPAAFAGIPVVPSIILIEGFVAPIFYFFVSLTLTSCLLAAFISSSFRLEEYGALLGTRRGHGWGSLTHLRSSLPL